MDLRHWPLFGLRLVTPSLELRLPHLEQLDRLAQRAAEGVHSPELMPFEVAWTDATSDERARATMQYHWQKLSAWSPTGWACPFAVMLRAEPQERPDDEHEAPVIGVQEIKGQEFALTREVRSGSWLGQPYQGKGYGTQMRAAVLELAFTHLGAEYARTRAFLDNPASLGVSRRLGYQPNGTRRVARRGAVAEAQDLVLSRADWLAHRKVPVQVHGLEQCRSMFGLQPS